MKKLGYLLLPACLLLAACQSNSGDEAMTETNQQTLYVGPELADCVGVAPMKCMKVRTDPGAPWEFLYQNIEDFNFESGYEYQLIVEKGEIKNPAADQPILTWKLVELVEKKPAQ